MSKSILAALLAVIVIGAAAWYYYDKQTDRPASTDQTDQTVQASPTPEVAVDSQGRELQPVAIEPTPASASVDTALASLRSAGLNVVADGEIAYQFVKADGGARVLVDGINVEIYSYVDAASQQEGATTLQGMIDAMSGDTDLDEELVVATVYQKSGLLAVVRGTDAAKNAEIARILGVK